MTPSRNPNDLSRFLGQIAPLGTDLAAARSQGVRIMTMGGSKGLTVQATIVAGVEEGIVPRPEAELAEERRLLYVAMTRARIADSILFESARAELSTQGREVLLAVGRAVAEQTHLFERIQVEGHSDLLPIRSTFPSNWELSAARAISVVLFLQDECGISPAQLSATGFASYQPVEPGTNEPARRRNRRIELVFVYSMTKALQPQ